MKKLLLIPLLFFLFSLQAKAQVISHIMTDYYGNNFFTTTTGTASIPIRTDAKSAWTNKGEGYLLFTFYYANDSSQGELPYSVSINGFYTCQIGSFVFYNDNIHQRAVISAKCPVNFSGNTSASTANSIEILTKGNGTRYFLFSEEGTFYDSETASSGGSSVDLSTIESQLSTLSGYVQYNNNINAQYFYDIRTLVIPKLNQIYDAINGSNGSLNTISANSTDIKNNTKETNDLIKSDDVSGAESSADSFVNNSAFDDSTGLSGIISMPLTFVNNLGSTCQPISLTIPYMDYNFQIPCIQSIINNYMPALVVIIKVVVNGLIIYWVMLDIFKIVKSAKNPDDDRIEVLDL